MLDKLNKCKNPYYQFYDDYNAYRERCQTSDPDGYEAMFNDIEQELVEQFTIGAHIGRNFNFGSLRHWLRWRLAGIEN